MREALEGKLREFDSLWARDGGPFDSEWVSEVLEALTAPGATEIGPFPGEDDAGKVGIAPSEATKSDGGVEGHAQSHALRQPLKYNRCGNRKPEGAAPEGFGASKDEPAGIKPGPSEPSSTRSEVSVEELADWLFANLRPDTEPRQDARALLDQFEIRRKK